MPKEHSLKRCSMPTRHSRVLVLGSGPAGYTAAIYAARAMLKPLIVQGIQPGGQLTITTDVENFPGFAKAIQGPWLMEEMKAQAEHMGTEVVSDTITEVKLRAQPIWLKGDSGTEYTCDALIICTGAQAKWLDLPSESEFKGFGVSACATCDGFFYRNRKVLVVGGGNTAVEEALFLTNFASEVTVIHRRNEFKAERILQERLFKHPKIKVKWDTTLDEVLGTSEPKGVTSVRLKNVKTGATEVLDMDGVFIAIGHKPATELFVGQLPFKNGGYLTTAPWSTVTEIPGVFAAGDVTDDIYRQAVTAAGMGCMAALEAEKWLHTQTSEHRLAAE
jgi:thioredoxin reductase (NADPH)